MKDTIIIWYNGSAMIVSKAVAKSLNLKDNQRLSSEAQFWQVLGANASYNLAICQHELTKSDN